VVRRVASPRRISRVRGMDSGFSSVTLQTAL
jgi:hypothetical protein